MLEQVLRLRADALRVTDYDAFWGSLLGVVHKAAGTVLRSHPALYKHAPLLFEGATWVEHSIKLGLQANYSVLSLSRRGRVAHFAC